MLGICRLDEVDLLDPEEPLGPLAHGLGLIHDAVGDEPQVRAGRPMGAVRNPGPGDLQAQVLVVLVEPGVAQAVADGDHLAPLLGNQNADPDVVATPVTPDELDQLSDLGLDGLPQPIGQSLNQPGGGGSALGHLDGPAVPAA